MKLLLFRLPGLSILSARCLITVDSLYVWLSRQQSLSSLTETDWTCYFENAESELSALASFYQTKTITLAAGVTR